MQGREGGLVAESTPRAELHRRPPIDGDLVPRRPRSKAARRREPVSCAAAPRPQPARRNAYSALWRETLSILAVPVHNSAHGFVVPAETAQTRSLLHRPWLQLSHDSARCFVASPVIFSSRMMPCSVFCSVLRLLDCTKFYVARSPKKKNLAS